MTEHPGDSAENRFRAFWAGVLAFVSFGLVMAAGLKLFGGRGDDDGGAAAMSAVDRQIVKVREANLAAVQDAQSALVSEDALDGAIESAAAALAGKDPSKTALEVPGSPTALENQKKAQAGQPASPTEEGDQASEKKNPDN